MEATELKLLSRKQAAQCLGVSIRTLDKILASGKLKFIQLFGPRTSVRIDNRDLNAYVEARK